MKAAINFGNFQGYTGVLAEQEMRAVLAVCAGLTGKQAARELGRAPGTLKKTLERVFFKLGVSSRAALIAEAFRRGLITSVSRSMTANPGPQHEHQHDRENHDGIFIA
ncbi:response regulator transcription factor [Pseudomonas sp. 11/12A]|uniref:response regulator transcription factor n=1 Tax=Pseudomonas sp. 11/12A TaxID=1506582 RepID=UPI0006456AD8|nr:LuxR C-terminal-related transcriptional regulator [Pseudomonas sp. 11/12A]